MKSTLVLLPIFALGKKSKCPFGFGESKEEDDTPHYRHPKVQAGETYLSEIYTCPAGAVTSTPV